MTSFTYDALDRVLTEAATGGATVTTTHTYTKTGQKLTNGNGTLTETLLYDIFGRMIRQTESDGVVKEFAYDENGNRIGFRLTRSGTIELDMVYNYDQLNRVIEVGRNNATIAKYSYDANGNRTMVQHPANNIHTGYEYNDANLVMMVDNYVGETQSTYYQYIYNLDGNQSANECEAEAYTYLYDHMGRLIEDGSYYGNTYYYTYDRFSNRETMKVMFLDNYEVAYTYDLNNRLTREVKTEDGVETVTTYTYDANGNQLTKVSLDSTETRSYNGLGQLVSVTGSDTPASYAYRPDGLRYKKIIGGVTHIQLWDGQNVVAEVGATGTVNTRYLRGINLVAREIDGALQYYQFNAHGDVVHRIDASGNVLKTYDYNAFGNELGMEPLDTNPFRYCGEYFDRETGTYYLRARNYEPSTGRFTTEDAVSGVATKLPNDQEVVDPLSLNRYTYCYNDPIKYADAPGTVAVAVAILISVGVGALVGAGIGAGVNAITQGLTKGWGNINLKEVGINALAGAATGALSGSGIGLPLVIGANMAIGIGAYMGTQAVNNESINPLALGLSALLGGASGWIGGNGADTLRQLSQVLSTRTLNSLLGNSFAKEIFSEALSRIIPGAVKSSGWRTLLGNAITSGRDFVQKGITGISNLFKRDRTASARAAA